MKTTMLPLSDEGLTVQMESLLFQTPSQQVHQRLLAAEEFLQGNFHFIPAPNFHSHISLFTLHYCDFHPPPIPFPSIPPIPSSPTSLCSFTNSESESQLR